jgi:CubicO group peptidase (beta-lactamase class C family)
MSVAVLQRGAVVWESGLGRQDLEASTVPTSNTPYFIGTLSQVFGATLLLERCVDQDSLRVTDPVVRWTPGYPEPATTVGQLLTHRATSGSYAYDPGRFANLTGVIVECADVPFRHLLASDIFDQLGMTRSVPGRELGGAVQPGPVVFSPSEISHYEDVIGQLTRAYRLSGGKPVRSTLPTVGVNASTGIITTVADLARFDRALRDDILLEPSTRTMAWTQSGGSMPTGLGWFVQNYNGEALVWQFDLTKDAASSMIVKLPGRDLTLIMLANSDGLANTFGLASGDATLSPFVRTFLKFFAP